MFVDEASITVQGGDGGNGCRSFRREKYVPRGGPDGGDGGDGGSVLLVAGDEVGTLLEFRSRTLFRAPRGRHGEGANRTGRSGADLRLRVPVGTVVLDEDSVRRLADLAAAGDTFVAARGGRGGRGNARFATATHRTPTRREPGERGQARQLRLELKLLADVGVVGLPNAGKSTLVSRISAARPRIADYPFTTLAPQLGVVDRGGFRSFVIADLPGLIEGAHRGTGLGHRFLRHVERCRLLLHLIDPTDSSRDAVADVRTIERELQEYGAGLAGRPRILVATKADALQSEDAVAALGRYAAAGGLELLRISAVDGTGIRQLVAALGERLDAIAARAGAAGDGLAAAAAEHETADDA